MRFVAYHWNVSGRNGHRKWSMKTESNWNRLKSSGIYVSHTTSTRVISGPLFPNIQQRLSWLGKRCDRRISRHYQIARPQSSPNICFNTREGGLVEAFSTNLLSPCSVKPLDSLMSKENRTRI